MKEQAVEFSYNCCPQCSVANPNPGTVPFRCRECGFSQFFGPVAAVGGLVVNERDQLLLVRRARNPGKGKWGLPGGFVDRGETVEGALLREVREETSLRVASCDYLMSHPNEYQFHGIISPVIDLFFVCTVDGPAQVSLAEEELDHHRWVRPTDADLANMAFHSNRLAIQRWLATAGKAC